jgi:hypothetical protein
VFASIGEPNAIKKSGIPNNFFSKCAIKRGIHQEEKPNCNLPQNNLS